VSIKFQTPNNKYQTINNDQNSKLQTSMILKKKKLYFSKMTEQSDSTNIQSSIINIQLGLGHWILGFEIYL